MEDNKTGRWDSVKGDSTSYRGDRLIEVKITIIKGKIVGTLRATGE